MTVRVEHVTYDDLLKRLKELEALDPPFESMRWHELSSTRAALALFEKRRRAQGEPQ